MRDKSALRCIGIGSIPPRSQRWSRTALPPLAASVPLSRLQSQSAPCVTPQVTSTPQLVLMIAHRSLCTQQPWRLVSGCTAPLQGRPLLSGNLTSGSDGKQQFVYLKSASNFGPLYQMLVLPVRKIF